MKVLSLFDGIGGAAQALRELGIKFEYYASEIDKYATQVVKKNHPEIKHLGDVNFVDFSEFVGIDLLVGGFPCQSFSGAGKQKSFEDERGKLFFKCFEALQICKPKYFLFENVASMKPVDRDFISEKLGVQPIMINSTLLTAQNRKRLYWTNLEVRQLEDQNITLKDIIENGVVDRNKSHCIDANYWKGGNLKSYFEKHRRQLVFQPLATREVGRRLTPDGKKRDDKNGVITRGYELRIDGKTSTLTTVQKDNYITENFIIRKLTPIECERLQGFPNNYTEGISNSQRYKALGNSFTVPVIKHILRNING